MILGLRSPMWTHIGENQPDAVLDLPIHPSENDFRKIKET